MAKPRRAKTVGRKRHIAGCCLLVIGGLVVGMWVASRWWHGELAWHGCSIRMTGGDLEYAVMDPFMAAPDGLTLKKRDTPKLGLWYGWQTIPETVTFRGSGGTMQVGEDVRWIFVHSHSVGLLDIYSVAFWPLPILLCGAAAVLLRSSAVARRRASTCACRACGYSLAGLAAAAACPECGSTPAVSKRGDNGLQPISSSASAPPS